MTSIFKVLLSMETSNLLQRTQPLACHQLVLKARMCIVKIEIPVSMDSNSATIKQFVMQNNNYLIDVFLYLCLKSHFERRMSEYCICCLKLEQCSSVEC